MLKIMLIDDEMYVRKGMHELINWNDLNMEIVGEAENGLEALKLVKILQPDIIITDIRMPILDGLELISEIMKLPHIEPMFIIISGYHDFKYAQQGIRYGVHDYILKPIDDEEMTATLQKLADIICTKNKHLLFVEEQSKHKMLEEIIKGRVRVEDELGYVQALGLTLHAGLLYCCVEFLAGLNDREISIQQLREVLNSLKEEFNILFITEQQGYRFGLLLLLDDHQHEIAVLKRKLSRLHITLTTQLNLEIGLYAGTIVKEISCFTKSTWEAKEAEKHKFAEDMGVILYTEIQDKPLYIFNVSQDIIDQLILKLEEKNRQGYYQIVNDMFNSFYNCRFTAQAVSGSLLRCITGIFAVYKEMGGNNEGLPLLKELAEHNQDGWSLKLLKNAFLIALDQAEECISRLRIDKPKGEIQQIKRYIDSHFTQNISLKSIAALFYMNPVYLGRLFRKSYNLYFNEYLLSLRIKEAKRLLRQTDMRMYEIAACVGFQNADYFITQFEKLVKQSPTEYRNLLKGNHQR